MQKVPYIIVLGDKEIESSTLAIRDKKGSDLGSMSIDAFSEVLINKIESKEV
jgi:threonyl-tRNA synthetase